MERIRGLSGRVGRGSASIPAAPWRLVSQERRTVGKFQYREGERPGCDARTAAEVEMSGGGGAGDTQFTRDSFASVPAGSEGFGAAGSGSSVNCDALAFVARLRNVDPREADEIAVGDVLDVVYTANPIPVIAVYRRSSGASHPAVAVGALLDRLGELLQCLKSSRDFEAEVQSISGGDIRVLVRAA